MLRVSIVTGRTRAHSSKMPVTYNLSTCIYYYFARVLLREIAHGAEFIQKLKNMHIAICSPATQLNRIYAAMPLIYCVVRCGSNFNRCISWHRGR